MYHPVTTEYDSLAENIKNVVGALIKSQKNYIVIYPNNDLGYELILNEYKRFSDNENFKIYPSVSFENFLTLLKNAVFMIGNSSAGVRESCVYGIPAIDVGNRQSGRYSTKSSPNIQHVFEKEEDVLKAISQIDKYRNSISSSFGKGNSTERFIEILNNEEIWNLELQKSFHELSWSMV